MERLRVGDSEIEYADQGDGEPVVLVHTGFSSDWFVPVAARAELADVRVVRVRRAGYVAGSAPPRHLSLADHADHLDALLDTLNVERAHIVGHSSGALIALQLAAARPKRVAGLVATLTELEGTDHMLPLRDPATLAALIATFVRQHRTQRLVDQV